MSVGILQLVWPGTLPAREAALCYPLYLAEGDFDHYADPAPQRVLTTGMLATIASEVESLRARSLAARRDHLVREFLATARQAGIVADVQPEKFILATATSGAQLAIIPAVGVPQALTCNEGLQLLQRIRAGKVLEVFLLFDERNVMARWKAHLAWLNESLPVKTVNVLQLPAWVKEKLLV
jgi:hypothetical protein